jgi:predicted MFS family arabinose efflux permease
MSTQPLETTAGMPGHAAMRMSVSALFLANGLVAGFWSVFVPAVQANLGIGETLMGLLILIGASAGFVGLMLSGLAVSRFGSRAVAVTAGLMLAPALALLSTATQFEAAVAFFVFFFLSMSVMDVAMNANGADVERTIGRTAMSSFHGFWSLGGMAGAASGGFLLAQGGQALLTGAAFALCAALTIAAMANLHPRIAPEPAEPRGKRRFRLPGRLPVYLFGVIALAAFTAEGSVIDWGAIYLREEAGADVRLSGFAFAGFSFAMMVSRFSGDALRRRLGGKRLLQLSSVLALVGFVLASQGGALPVIVAGFLLAGLGCANLVPVAFSAAANVPGVSSGTGIAIATMFGYFGLLCAPALLGFVGERHGFAPVYLGFAFAMVGVFALAALARSHLRD